MSLMGIDVGTTGCKAVAFDHDGKILASSYREYPLVTPNPGWFELDSRQVWEDITTVIREVAGKTASDPITAFSVSCQGEAVTPVDADGNMLDNAAVSFDGRTAGLVSWWEENVGGQKIFQTTGQPLASLFTALKVMWIRENKPEVFKKADKFLGYEELVYHQCGLEPVTDYSLAGRTMLFDVQKQAWSEEMLGHVGLTPNHFAKAVPSGTVVGTISDAAAKHLGLPKGVVAVTGGHDQPCQILGCGVIKPRVGAYGLGTVECVAPSFSELVLNDTMLKSNLCCYHHAFPGLYISLVYNYTGGVLFRWVRDQFGAEEAREAEASGRDVYDILTEKAPKEPTSLLVLPHFTTTGTPHFDNHSRGAIMGLTLDTTKEDIVRAALEGVTYELRLCLDLLEEAGVAVDELRATGGGAKSDYWLQIKTDIMNRPLMVPAVSEAGCLGCSILSGVATDVYASTQEAVDHLVKIDRTYEPNEANAKRYAEQLELYKEIYPNNKSLFHRLAGIEE